jgi:hypothetical protein
MLVLMEVLQEGKGSVGYGGKIVAPGEKFACWPEHVEEIVASKLAKLVEGFPVESAIPAPAGMSETAKAEERQALFDELVSLGITAAAKTNTKTLRHLLERARAEARQ